LTAVDLERRQIGTQLLFDDDVALLNFRREKAHCFLDNRIYVFAMQLRPRWPDGAQELGDDRVKPSDFRSRDVHRVLTLGLRIVAKLGLFAIHKLKMDLE